MADPCNRCRALDACIPHEDQLRILVSEDWTPADLAFHPKAMTQEQAVAAELFTAAAGRFVKAFGVEVSGARVNALLQVLRAQARTARVIQRQLEARTEINARARVEYERGAYDAAHAIEGEPTPPYDGIERDNAWLGRA